MYSFILMSIFRDKFFINTNYDDAYERRKVKKFFNLFGRKIIQKYRKVQPIDQKYENAPTFREFVHYLLDIPLKGFNSHWLPIYQKCKPCHINYSIIGRYSQQAKTKGAIQTRPTVLQCQAQKRIFFSSDWDWGWGWDSTTST